MDIIFIETPEFVKKVDFLENQEEFIQLQDELIDNPLKGKLVPGTGGARKVRMRIKGSGKSGGARVIYYFYDMKGEIWFLDIYVKNEKADLYETDKKKLYNFIKEKIK
jgi:mRNA-degrading endonuclease RelE of RelBE toxin-antitoxin system